MSRAPIKRDCHLEKEIQQGQGIMDEINILVRERNNAKQGRNKVHPKGKNEARATVAKGMRMEIQVSSSKTKRGRIIKRTGDPYQKTKSTNETGANTRTGDPYRIQNIQLE